MAKDKVKEIKINGAETEVIYADHLVSETNNKVSIDNKLFNYVGMVVENTTTKPKSLSIGNLYSPKSTETPEAICRTNTNNDSNWQYIDTEIYTAKTSKDYTIYKWALEPENIHYVRFAIPEYMSYVNPYNTNKNWIRCDSNKDTKYRIDLKMVQESGEPYMPEETSKTITASNGIIPAEGTTIFHKTGDYTGYISFKLDIAEATKLQPRQEATILIAAKTIFKPRITLKFEDGTITKGTGTDDTMYKIDINNYTKVPYGEYGDGGKKDLGPIYLKANLTSASLGLYNGSYSENVLHSLSGSGAWRWDSTIGTIDTSIWFWLGSTTFRVYGTSYKSAANYKLTDGFQRFATSDHKDFTFTLERYSDSGRFDKRGNSGTKHLYVESKKTGYYFNDNVTWWDIINYNGAQYKRQSFTTTDSESSAIYYEV